MSFYLDDEGVLRSSLDASNYARGMQSDVAKMRYMATLIETNAEHIMINKAQVELVVKRIIFIYNMLKQLPNPRPTPQILCVMRSVNHLISQMSSKNELMHHNGKDALWVELLMDHFTCVDVFTTLLRRLRSVWSMHSTAKWEHEDKEALDHDAQENAQLLINLIHPTKHQLSSLSSLSELWWRATMQLKHNTENNNNLVDQNTHSDSKEKLTEQQELEQEQIKESEEEVFDVYQEHVATANNKNELHDKENEFASEESHDTDTAATADDIISYYKRRTLGSWRLPLEQLWCDGNVNITNDKINNHHQECNVATYLLPNTNEALSDKTVRKIDNTVHTTQINGTLRFVIKHGWRYHKHHVVVKKLTASSASTQCQVLETLESFVQDAAVRSRWCYPGLVTCYGGFTETFATYTLSANKLNNIIENDIATVPANNHANSNVNAELDKPTLCLGLIMEDLSIQHRSIDDLSEAPLCTSDNINNLNNIRNDSPNHHNKTSNINITFLSLQELLFVEQHRFTILESITLTLQLADTLQYILMDEKDVPKSVVNSWITVALSNVFIACSVYNIQQHQKHHHKHRHNNKDQHGESKLPTSERNVANKESNSEEREVRENVELRDLHQEIERQSSSTLFAKSTSTSEDRSHNSSSHSRLSFIPLRTEFNEFVVKYAPPLHVAHGAINRWRPHTRATSPVCYALAQFLLALMTLRPPFAQIRSQRALRHLTLGEDVPDEKDDKTLHNTVHTNNIYNDNDNSFSRNSSIESENYESAGWGVRTTVKRTAAIGYTLPSMLPSKLRLFCHEAMSLDHSRRPMSLDELRRQLHDAQEEIKLCRITYLPLSLPSRTTSALLSSPYHGSKHDNRAHSVIEDSNEHGNIEMAVINERQQYVCNYVDDYGVM